MDDAVAEVFERMLQLHCAATPEFFAMEADIAATITISGRLEARCVLEFPSASARRLTDAFLGSAKPEWDDSMVADTVGELCNMITGGWKKRLSASAWGTDLSVPFISRGATSNVPNFGATTVSRAYVFDKSPFVIRIIMVQATAILLPGHPGIIRLLDDRLK